MINKRRLGQYYENVASNYLKSEGYKIIEHNFYSRNGEIDIIAVDKDTLVFIEVKFRSTSKYGYGYEAVDKRKQQRIINTAKYYIFLKKIDNNIKMRFDVLSIDGKNISIIKNAFP